jgi:hypothetical protein
MNAKEFGKALMGLGCLCIAFPFLALLFVMGVAMIRAGLGW